MRALLLRLDVPEWAAELLQAATHIVVILFIAWFGLRLATRLLERLRERVARHADDAGHAQRVATLLRALRYLLTVVVVVLAGLLTLHEMGISIAPLLAAAGVAGIAIGFGAQSLVKDYFTGVLMLLEDQLRVGDVVEAGGKAGAVEAVTLRYVRLRDYEGHVHYVPNSAITTVTNRSRGYAFAVIDVGIAYREDVDEALALMREVGGALRQDPELAADILEDLEIAGVDRWDDSAIVLRCRMKTLPLKQWGVRRAFLKRLKRAFDEHGVEIPFPHLTVYAGQPKDGGAAPPFALRLGPRAAPPAAQQGAAAR